MKVILVPEKKRKESKPRESKPRTIVQVIQKIIPIPMKRSNRKRDFRISFFAIWSVALWSLFLSSPEANIGEFLFYWGLVSSTALASLLILEPREEREMKDNLALDAVRSFPAFGVWGILIFFVTFLPLAFRGATFVLPSSYEILRQAILIVPSETVVFIVFLPLILDKGLLSRVPFIPGFVVAQVCFATMHYISGSLTLAMSIVAFLIGILWYTMYKAGDLPKYGKYFGLPAVLSFHLIWNLVIMSAMATTGTSTDPLVAFFELMGLPALMLTPLLLFFLCPAAIMRYPYAPIDTSLSAIDKPLSVGREMCSDETFHVTQSRILQLSPRGTGRNRRYVND